MFGQQEVDTQKGRPIQMGEFLRKYVSRRLLALGEGEIAALATAMRQLGVGSQGGAQALAIFHELFHDDWAAGALTEPLARINVDEKNCSAKQRRGSSQNTRQQQHVNIERFLTSNKMGLRQWPKIEVQSKEALMDLWTSGSGFGGDTTRGRMAALQACADDPSEYQRAESLQLFAGRTCETHRC